MAETAHDRLECVYWWWSGGSGSTLNKLASEHEEHSLRQREKVRRMYREVGENTSADVEESEVGEMITAAEAEAV